MGGVWWRRRLRWMAKALNNNNNNSPKKKERKQLLLFSFCLFLLDAAAWFFSYSFFFFTYIKEETFIYSHDVCCCCCLASVRSRSAAFTLDFCLYNGGTTTRKVQEPSRFRRTLMLMMRIQPTDFSRSLGGPPFSTWLVCVLDSYHDYYSLNNREI